ncbi:hypothetical protein LMG6001_04184 [Achromobacter insolitus]|uniref:hypothetical protein n=1 Tax=Achromobacter insolitus TaxID=217204 RepID=UPI0013AFCB63|nr:hypothetical protein [Achromobacter insolitus]CAB3955955.1 hypothetical protein LMG6001_04184 [Achromobacter insolitus]
MFRFASDRYLQTGCRHLAFHIATASVLMFAGFPAYGEKPLYVEGLVTEAGKWKLDLAIAYANRDGYELQVGEPLFVQTGPASFFPVYAGIEEEKTNLDMIVATIGLRYGINAHTDIYGRTSGFWSEIRSEANGYTHASSFGELSDAWLGISHIFKDDDDTPGLIGFAEIAVVERNEGNASYLKSAAVGLTAYKALDPVVLSMNVAYRSGGDREVGGVRRKPGSLFMTSGSVAFAANDRISLSTGVQWMSSMPDSINGLRTGFRRTSTNLLLGAGYGISHRNVVNFSMKSNISGQDGADMNLAWSHTF